VIAPTPPPDVDVEGWERSIRVLEGWRPQRLCLTHFGEATDVERHLGALRVSLRHLVDHVGRTDLETFVAEHIAWLDGHVDPETAIAYKRAVPPDHIWLGLHRWHSKREEAAA